MTMYLRHYNKRRRREQREHGHLMALAFSEKPGRIDEEFADPPEVIDNQNSTVMETEKWWTD